MMKTVGGIAETSVSVHGQKMNPQLLERQLKMPRLRSKKKNA
jgi:hypothetical protein